MHGSWSKMRGSRRGMHGSWREMRGRLCDMHASIREGQSSLCRDSSLWHTIVALMLLLTIATMGDVAIRVDRP